MRRELKGLNSVPGNSTKWHLETGVRSCQTSPMCGFTGRNTRIRTEGYTGLHAPAPQGSVARQGDCNSQTNNKHGENVQTTQ